MRPAPVIAVKKPIPAASAASAAATAAVAAASAAATGSETSATAVGSAKPKWKGVKYRNWSAAFQQTTSLAKRYKKPSDNELTDMLYRAAICIRPSATPISTGSGDREDQRRCLFCHVTGDGVSDGPARLVNVDVDRWVHLNCALWHEDVFEMVNGALMNVDVALKQSAASVCLHCEASGASVKCFKHRCSALFHLGCAIKENCVFFKNKSVYCQQHAPKGGDKDDQLTTLAVFRRVYVNRDENRQVIPC